MDPHRGLGVRELWEATKWAWDGWVRSWELLWGCRAALKAEGTVRWRWVVTCPNAMASQAGCLVRVFVHMLVHMLVHVFVHVFVSVAML